MKDPNNYTLADYLKLLAVTAVLIILLGGLFADFKQNVGLFSKIRGAIGIVGWVIIMYRLKRNKE